jgi:hypothetical protein
MDQPEKILLVHLQIDRLAGLEIKLNQHWRLLLLS